MKINARRYTAVPHLASSLLITVLVCTATSAAHAALNGTIETYVGGGNGDGDAAIHASIDPRGLAVAGSGAPDIYVADGKNNRVRRIDGDNGLISTIAGTGAAAYSGDGGPGQNATLRFPLDVTVDGAGNVYIADTFNNRVRKVGTDGRIATLAGNGVPTYSGEGVAAQESVSSPYGVAIGPDGNLYIADFGNNRIRRVSPPGCVASTCSIDTVVGNGSWGFGGDNGQAKNATLRNPADVAFDAAGNMYIADWGNHRVRRVTPSGTITSVAGGGLVGAGGSIGDGGNGLLAVLNYPVQVDVDSSGNVYIADSAYRRIRMLQAGTFTISTVAGTGNAGSGGDGGGPNGADLYAPWGIAATTPGTFWLSQTTELPVSQHNRVRKVTSSQNIQSVAGGGLGSGGAALNALVDPRGGKAVDAGGALPDLYFADGNNNVVRRVDGDTGIIDTIAGSGVAGYSGDGGPALNAKLRTPLDVTVDAASGVVYVADSFNNVVRRIANGTITTVAGTGQWGFSGEGTATQKNLAAPRGVDVDRFGALYIADCENNRIRKLTGGQITTVAGNGNWGYSGDGGDARSAALRNPWDVVVDDDGTLYISDSQSSRIRRVSSAGIITTFAGNGLSGFGGDGGRADFAKLSVATQLALDGPGNLYFSDSQNNRVRRVDAATQIIDTVAGNGLTGFSGDGGAALSAALGDPTGVLISGAGNPLFISTKDVGRLRMVDFGLQGPPPTATFTRTPIPPSPTNPSTPTRTPVLPTATRTSTSGPSTVAVSGRITYYANNQLAVPAVDVDLSGPTHQAVRTSSNGIYNATNIPVGSWLIRPTKQGGYGSAISSLDAARVLQVVAGMNTFNALQRLACDVTGDGTLSALDAVRILQFSAGVVSELPVATLCGSDWMFYPLPDAAQNQHVVPPDVDAGTCRAGSILMNPMLVPLGNQDFDGVLFGDCTGNWTASGGAAFRKAVASATTVRAGKLRRGSGNRVRLPIYVQGPAPFQAVDVRIGYDPSALTLSAVRPHGAAFEALTSVSNDQPDVIAVSLANAKPIDATGGALLSIEFSASDAGVGAPAVRLLSAQVDEQSASVVNSSPR